MANKHPKTSVLELGRDDYHSRIGQAIHIDEDWMDFPPTEDEQMEYFLHHYGLEKYNGQE